jgi:hypothetical protein
LNLSGDWYHGASRLERFRALRGYDSGEWLAGQLASQERTLPVVLLSEDQDGLAVPGIDRQIAYDLCGLANTYLLDADAAWAITDSFGRTHSCHSGAIRIYWPRFSAEDDPYNHPLWLAARLRHVAGSPADVSDKFRRQLRGLVMGASARSVVRPREIDEIRLAASQRHYADLRARASSVSDFQGLADTYAKDNDVLRASLAKVQSELELTRAQLDAALLQLQYRESVDIPLVPDPPEVAESETRTAPAEGEIRFYKKLRSTPNYDVVAPRDDCGHNRWQSGHGGEKAKKGIERYEQQELDTLWHCGTCTGGGVWKVRW